MVMVLKVHNVTYYYFFFTVMTGFLERKKMEFIMYLADNKLMNECECILLNINITVNLIIPVVHEKMFDRKNIYSKNFLCLFFLFFFVSKQNAFLANLRLF